MTGHSLLDEVESGPAALREGQALGTAAAEVGFDWATALDALDKVEEELHELRAEIEEAERGTATSARDRLEDEIGDVLFAIANVARKLGIDAESAVARTNQKFRRRFAHIEDAARVGQTRLEDMSLEQMEALWQQAKPQ